MFDFCGHPLLTTSEIPDICFKISSKAAGLLLIALPLALLLESRLLVSERRRLLFVATNEAFF
jgi:hypothetical protein